METDKGRHYRLLETFHHQRTRGRRNPGVATCGCDHTTAASAPICGYA